jgi:hypothetical protein
MEPLCLREAPLLLEQGLLRCRYCCLEKEVSGRFLQAAGPGNYLAIKESSGSIGAPLLMEALPERRIGLLVRMVKKEFYPNNLP